MKKVLSLLAVVFAVGLSTAAMDAEAAKRMGSGKSIGMQRQATQDKAPSAPTQSNAAAPAAGAAGAAAAPSRSWMGPIAGLAAGLGIAALASHLGTGLDGHDGLTRLRSDAGDWLRSTQTRWSANADWSCAQWNAVRAD